MDSNKGLNELLVESTSDDHKYSRDSFDRFGDDLCELLLSYLTFKEKIFLEDVCRQWKRTVYNKQTILRVSNVHPLQKFPYYVNELLVPIKNFITLRFAPIKSVRTIDVKRLKSLLNKCKYINKIVLIGVYIEGPLLELIAQMCPYLKSIQLDLIGLKEEDIISFGQKCGPNLQKIRFNNTFIGNIYLNNFREFGRKMLSFCTNIKSIQCSDIALVNDTRLEFLPKLESFEIKLNFNDSIKFKLFIDKYEKRLKKLKIRGRMNFKTLITTMEQISRLKNIEDLNISFHLMTTRIDNNVNLNTISDKLTEIAKNCPKITRFNLNLYIFQWEVKFLLEHICDCLVKFVNLRQLKVVLGYNILLQIDETIDTLKPLKPLTHLSIECFKMGDPFFNNIHLLYPHLKVFHLYTNDEWSDTLIESLSKLKNLTKISIGCQNKALSFITDLGISKLLEYCPKLRSIEFLSPPNITTKTVDNLIEFANKIVKNISFICGSARNGEETLFSSIDLTAYTNIPNNLTIIIKTVHQNI